MELSNYDIVVLTQQEELSVSGGGIIPPITDLTRKLVEMVVQVIEEGSKGKNTWMTQVPPNVLFS